MHTILKTIMAVMLLSFTACAEQEAVSKVQKSNQTKKKGTSIMPTSFGAKPNYRLKVTGSLTNIEVFMNDVRIYKDFEVSQFFILYPINDYVVSGENELKVRIFSSKSEKYIIDKQANFNVTLEIRTKDGEYHTVSTIAYDHHAKERLEGSTAEGSYSLKDTAFKAMEFGTGEVEVAKIETEKVTIRNTNKAVGFNFRQKLKFPTPFPRWKFMDAEDIVDDAYFDYDLATYEKLRRSKKMQGLYDACEKIYTLIKNKKVDEAMALFEEANQEEEIAWRKPKGSIGKSIAVDIKNELNSPVWELVPFDREESYFFIEDNKKLAYIPGVIMLKKKGVSLYRKYKMKFRYEKGKWILTR